MTATAYFSQADGCWYVPVVAELFEEGSSYEPVRVELRDGQLLITQLYAQATLPARQDPTHVMRIEVPLNLRSRSIDFDAVAEALRLALTLSRATFSGEICADPQVTMIEIVCALPDGLSEPP